MNERRTDAEDDLMPLEREILAHARGRKPSRQSSERTLAALGVAGTVLSAGAAASAAGTGARATFTLFAKWLGIGVVSGAAVVGGATELARRAPRAAKVDSTSEVSSSRNASVEGTQIAVASSAKETNELVPAKRPEPVEPSARALRASPSTDPSAKSHADSEFELLDQASSALSRHDSTEALRLLERHRSEFQDGQLGEEATYVQIKALYERGDRTRAERTARDFLVTHPNSPHARRVRAVMAAHDESR